MTSFVSFHGFLTSSVLLRRLARNQWSYLQTMFYYVSTTWIWESNWLPLFPSVPTDTFARYAFLLPWDMKTSQKAWNRSLRAYWLYHSAFAVVVKLLNSKFCGTTLYPQILYVWRSICLLDPLISSFFFFLTKCKQVDIYIRTSPESVRKFHYINEYNCCYVLALHAPKLYYTGG